MKRPNITEMLLILRKTKMAKNCDTPQLSAGQETLFVATVPSMLFGWGKNLQTRLDINMDKMIRLWRF